VVANGGTLWRPRLVERVESPTGVLLRQETEAVQGHVELAPVVYEFLRQALVGVVEEGSGKAARVPGVTIAGKTGTAQTREFRDETDRKRRDHDHAWFAGFAPAEDPRVAVLVFVEKGGFGGQVAAPIAREVFKAIFLEKVASAGQAG
jgi:cell division protein FtsI/penicillin-binding protein 2